MSVSFLWTDVCFLFVLFISSVIFLASLRKQPVRHSCLILLHKPLAVSAGIVLVFFLIVGVLDSIHLSSGTHSTDNATTLLDRVLSPVGSTYEKTYSAPFALNLFVSEMQMVNDVVQQVYPRLSYPPQEIKTLQDKHALIQTQVLKALGMGVVVFCTLWLLCIGIKARTNRTWVFSLSAAGWSAVVTLSVLTTVLFCAYWLSRSFHVLGTGQVGQDIFYFSIKSIRTGLIIGSLTTLFMSPLALFFGLIAGYFGGFVDDVVQYIYTTLSSIPGVLLITASVLSLQTYISMHPQQFTTLAQSADARLLALCLILGVTSWTSLCRLLRAETLKLREMDFVVAARALGTPWYSILWKHLVPNVMHIVVITLVLDFSFLVMAEAVLSYVGVGVSPMTISWGNMINGARLELARDPVVWWPIGAAFMFLFLLVLAINLFADALRDAFDPHMAMV